MHDFISSNQIVSFEANWRRLCSSRRALVVISYPSAVLKTAFFRSSITFFNTYNKPIIADLSTSLLLLIAFPSIHNLALLTPLMGKITSFKRIVLNDAVRAKSTDWNRVLFSAFPALLDFTSRRASVVWLRIHVITFLKLRFKIVSSTRI